MTALPIPPPPPHSLLSELRSRSATAIILVYTASVVQYLAFQVMCLAHHQTGTTLLNSGQKGKC